MDIQSVIAAVEASGHEASGQWCAALRAYVGEAQAFKVERDTLKVERDNLASNNAALLGQKGAANNKLRGLEDKLAGVMAAIGADGDDGFERLKGLGDEVATLTKERDTAVAARAEVEEKVAALERGLHYQKVAALLKADADALERLISLPPDRIAINADQVTIVGDDGKTVTWPDYLAQQPDYVRRAVLPAEAQGDPPPPPKGPTAPPTGSGQKDEARTVVAAAGFKFPL